MTHVQLAAALDIDQKTLEKHFAYELSVGAEQQRLKVREAVYRRAEKGDVAAARLLEQWTGATTLTEQAMGVKAQRNEAANTAEQGTAWEGILPSSTLRR
jgi:hypothetical protein